MELAMILLISYLIPLLSLSVLNLAFDLDDDFKIIITIISIIPILNTLLILVIIGKIINFFISKD